jgi:hypothetical protein
MKTAKLEQMAFSVNQRYEKAEETYTVSWIKSIIN